jgi:hypothetical protein
MAQGKYWALQITKVIAKVADDNDIHCRPT